MAKKKNLEIGVWTVRTAMYSFNLKCEFNDWVSEMQKAGYEFTASAKRLIETIG